MLSYSKQHKTGQIENGMKMGGGLILFGSLNLNLKFEPFMDSVGGMQSKYTNRCCAGLKIKPLMHTNKKTCDFLTLWQKLSVSISSARKIKKTGCWKPGFNQNRC